MKQDLQIRTHKVTGRIRAQPGYVIAFLPFLTFPQVITLQPVNKQTKTPAPKSTFGSPEGPSSRVVIM